MLFLIWAILIIMGLLFPKSKIITFLLTLFMVISICFRTQGADWTVYTNEYKWSAYQIFSDVHYVGYLILEQFGHRLGLTFEQFTVFVGIISIMLFLFGTTKLTSNINVVFALFLIYPFSHEAVQVRTFLANSIIIAALPLILKEDNKIADRKKRLINIILFYVLSILACTIHFEAAFYLICVSLMLFLPKKYGRSYIFGGTIILFALIQTGILPTIVSRFNTRIAYWLSGKTGLGIIIPIFISLVIWYGMQMVGKCCVAKSSETEKKIFERLLRLSNFIIILIPLFCYDITFNRLWRLFLFVFYIMIANILNYSLKKNTYLWIIFLMTILFISICAYEGVFVILNGFFEDNAIFKNYSVF